jgi:hypothetical protein
MTQRGISQRSGKDSGQLSLDFLAGTFLFMVGLVITISMMSGVLVHLQGKTIDYDAVAYRTGVILVEDPGYWEIGDPVTSSPDWFERQGKGNNWENLFTSDSAKNQELKQYVLRLGFENDKQYPGVLSKKKLDSFFSPTIFTNEKEITDRLFFSDYPYKYAIRIADMNNNLIGWRSNTVNNPSQIPSNTGYIRRIVQVKDSNNGQLEVIADSVAVGIGSTANRHSVVLKFNELFNQTIGPNYWISPQNDGFVINIQSEVNALTLNQIGLSRYSPGMGNITDADYQKFITYSYGGSNQTVLNNATLPMTIIGPSTPLTVYFLPGIFNSQDYPDTSQETLKLYFQSGPDVESSESVNYENSQFTPSKSHSPPPLVPAVMEVWVW